MPAFEPQALTFKTANAVVLAELAKAAYGEYNEAKTAAAACGLTAFEWIDLTEQFQDVYGFVAGGPEYVVIAFRGTDPKDWKNWMTDCRRRLRALTGYSKVPPKLVKYMRDLVTRCSTRGQKLNPH